jgi:hypothetical protein
MLLYVKVEEKKFYNQEKINKQINKIIYKN